MTQQQVMELVHEGKKNLEIAKILGISRQRVSQITLMHGVKRKKQYDECRECRRPFNKRIRNRKDGICGSCLDYLAYRLKHPEAKKHVARNIFYPKRCLNCHKRFRKSGIRKIGGKGLCRKCYDRQPERVAKMREYHKRYWEKYHGKKSAAAGFIR